MFLKRDTLGRYGTGTLSDLEKIAHEYEIPLEYLCKCGKLVMKCSDCRFGWNERGLPGSRDRQTNELLVPEVFNKRAQNAVANVKSRSGFATPPEPDDDELKLGICSEAS